MLPSMPYTTPLTVLTARSTNCCARAPAIRPVTSWSLVARAAPSRYRKNNSNTLRLKYTTPVPNATP